MNKIKENQIELINGDNSIKIKTNGLKIGTYMLYYETDGYSKYLKFSKTK